MQPTVSGIREFGFLSKTLFDHLNERRSMDRKEFISQVGIGAASLLFLNCVGGCSKSADTAAAPPVSAPTGVDFRLDLSASSNAALATNGGFVYTNGIIVARTVSGSYIAVSQACTHQGTSVQYQSSDRFFCPNHGSVFSTTGAVVTGPATLPLTKYNTSLSGNMLRVFS
jgi:cytochrome b6-f complex iron-sulfur subunit